ncbi:MAG TPA: hypothetical protein IAA95_08690 [Candidatus Aveggerthella excrementigallinarum]|nr:hypothetical protein [Candidatus Aveggerthella excrementigallinarum]
MKELSLKQNLVWNTVGCLMYQGCQWLTTILVVILSTSYENSGILAFAMATGNIFTGLATYNVRTFQISDVRGQFSSENYIAFRIITVVLASVLCSAYSFAVAPSVGTGIAMIAFLLFKADESFSNVLYGIDQKALRMDFIGISQGMRGILSLAAFALSLLATDNLVVAFVAMFVSCAAVTILYDIPHSRKLDTVGVSITKKNCIDLFRICAPSVIAILAYGFVSTIARQWFGIQYGEEALGIYSAVATPCVLVQVMANYLYSPFLVPIARSWSSRNNSELRSQLKKLITGIIGVIVICVALSAAFGAPVIELVYGSSIGDYSWMITPAMIAASLMALDYLLTDLFIVMRKFFLAVLINVVALASCIASADYFMSALYMNGINVVIIVAFAVGIVVGIAALVVQRRLQSA